MEVVEDIVIVGGGVAGLTTSLGLHRLGIRSLVLETSNSLRAEGLAYTTWTNAWRALDAVGVGESLRRQHDLIQGIVVASTKSGLPLTERLFFKSKGKCGDHEVRRVRRKLLLETLANELPKGTVRYSSKVVSIEDSGFFKLVHLADGSVLKAKVLIGSDGVNSVVAKSLGFKKPAFVDRTAIRGFADFKRNHGFDPKFSLFFGNGVRSGFLPCDDNIVNWFFTFTPSTQENDTEKELMESPAKMKEFVLKKLANVPDRIKAVLEHTEIDTIICSPLRIRHPWEILWGNISKGNVCVIGDALHPMTPDIGQGGGAALEDGVILARLLAEALAEKPSGATKEKAEKEEFERIEMALNKFARERRWRGFELASTSYMVGYIQQSNGMVMSFLRDKLLAAFLPDLKLKMADFDCGTLKTASATCMD